jgi:hypothetical protein
VRTPRAKPQVPAVLQLASADAQLAQPSRTTAAAATDKAEAKGETLKPETLKPETLESPADIINARGFWGDDASTPKQATADQVAAISARKALEAADPQSTASTPAAYQAMAYLPPTSSTTDRSNIVAASAPIPRSVRPTSGRNPNAATEINTIAARGAPGLGEPITNATRLSAAKGNDIWLRIVMLAPSASSAMSVTMMGDVDMTQMRAFFVKPQSTIAMGFSDDPMPGLASDHFAGAAITKLEIRSLTLHTALLR